MVRNFNTYKLALHDLTGRTNPARIPYWVDSVPVLDGPSRGNPRTQVLVLEFRIFPIYILIPMLILIPSSGYPSKSPNPGRVALLVASSTVVFTMRCPYKM